TGKISCHRNTRYGGAVVARVGHVVLRRRARGTHCEEGDAQTRAQGGVSGGGARHPHPAGDQGDAEGDADRRRQAADPLCDGRGEGGGDRAVLFRHRPRQERDRGLLRRRLRAGSDAARARQDRTARRDALVAARCRADRLYPPAAPAGPRPRRVVRAQPGRRRAVRGAAGRRSDGVRAALPAADGRGVREDRRQRRRRRGAARADQPLRRARHRRGRRAAGAGPRRRREAGARGGAVEPDDHRPLHHPARDLLPSRQDQAGQRQRDPAHRRAGGADRRRPSLLRAARRRAPLRLRRQARLSRSQYRARARARRSRPGLAARAAPLPVMPHRFHPTILREYDIRGIVGETLFAADAHALGRAFAATALAAGGRRLAVGYDGRLTSPELEAALVDGLAEGGAEVTRIGLGPTPMLYYAAATLGIDGGVMVTGSHNPPDHNGFKLVLGGKPFYGPAIQKLAETAAALGPAGSRGRVAKRAVFADYVARIARDYDGERPLKVAWDPGNGATG